MQRVLSLTSVEDVVARVTGPAASEHATVHEVVPLLALDLVGPVAALERVSTGPSADDVVAPVAPDLIVSGACRDHVRGGRPVDDVCALRSRDRRRHPQAGLLRRFPGRGGDGTASPSTTAASAGTVSFRMSTPWRSLNSGCLQSMTSGASGVDCRSTSQLSPAIGCAKNHS